MNRTYTPGDDVAVTVMTPAGERELVASVVQVTDHSIVVTGLDAPGKLRELRLDSHLRPVRRQRRGDATEST